MKRLAICITLLLGAGIAATAQNIAADGQPLPDDAAAIFPDEAYPTRPTVPVVERAEKSLYIPEDLRGMDLDDPASKWSLSRMVSTPDVAVWWADGFGQDLGQAPDLEGKNMKVDLSNLVSRLQNFYDFYRRDLDFLAPGTKADRYKMMVMLDYSLDGMAYGGDYDGQIGALWVAPNRVQDRALNCIAHELGHSFQLQTYCDTDACPWADGGFYEMTSQWMLWQVNPDWQREERYHLDAFADLTHKAFLHSDNIYHSPYVLEFWGEKHGLPIIARLYREATCDEDPAMAYKRLTGMSQQEFNDEMWHNYARLANWDIDRVRDHTRAYTSIWHTKLVNAGKGWKRVAPENAPENYGFNIIPVNLPQPGHTVTVDFRGEAGCKGYNAVNTSKAGWRYGLVAVDSEGREHYGEMQSAAKGRVEYTAPAGTEIDRLWLVVMGAPTEHWPNPITMDESGSPLPQADVARDAQWPYSIKLTYN